MKFNCTHCDEWYLSSLKLREHELFIHNFLMPDCSTGIAEKQFEGDMKLRKRYFELKLKTQIYKSKLKREYLEYHHRNSVLLRIVDTKDKWFTKQFEKELENHRKHDELTQMPNYDNYMKWNNKFKRITLDINTKKLVV